MSKIWEANIYILKVLLLQPHTSDTNALIHNDTSLEEICQKDYSTLQFSLNSELCLYKKPLVTRGKNLIVHIKNNRINKTII